MPGKKAFWIRLSLVNLALTALLGLILRTKILFPIPEIDFRHMLSAHSHFAFGGWVTLVLMTLLLYDVLPEAYQGKKIYQWSLWGIEICSMGMALSFPFQGYALFSIIFSTGFILVTYVFTAVFLRDLFRSRPPAPVRLLCMTALVALVVSSIGPFTLAHMMSTGSGDGIRYRDSIYLFLHFQYNGFFTLSVTALYFNAIYSRAEQLVRHRMQRFSVFLCLSVLPSFFLSILWHPDNTVLLIIAAIGCVFILLALAWFFMLLPFLRVVSRGGSSIARWFLLFCSTAFVLKMFFQMGTMIPGLDRAIYANRPVIIGFLHMVFLGLITFYVLYHLIRAGVFRMDRGFTRAALWVFAAGILAHVTILLLQGFFILLKTTSDIFQWMIWLASIGLLAGAVMIVLSGPAKENKKGL